MRKSQEINLLRRKRALHPGASIHVYARLLSVHSGNLERTWGLVAGISEEDGKNGRDGKALKTSLIQQLTSNIPRPGVAKTAFVAPRLLPYRGEMCLSKTSRRVKPYPSGGKDYLTLRLISVGSYD